MADLDKIIADSMPLDETERLKRRLAEEQRAHAATRRATSKAEARVAELETLMDRFAAVSPVDQKVPKWMASKRKRRDIHRAIAFTIWSDWHLDEVVDLREMQGMNAFDRSIAERRLERITERTIAVCKQDVAGITFEGITIAMNGDIITGDIHDMAITNEAPTPATIAHWVPLIASALVHLADNFGQVHVVCTSGNHDRDPSKKRTPTQQRERSAFTWIIYNWLADALRADDRITFTISVAPGIVYPIYNTVVHQIHGDAIRSQGGVGGIQVPLMKYLYRIDQMHARTSDTRIDLHAIGHFHQYLTGPNYTLNGSLKGFDSYAAANGFGFEKPRQALAVITPERGVTMQMPIYAD